MRFTGAQQGAPARISMDWNNVAFIFPGQGSQQVGMGADLAQAFPQARETFAQADALLGFALSKLCFEGPSEQLQDTRNTQPALYVMGVALWRVLQAELGEALRPAFVAGHSLGELTALTAADALSFEHGVQLVRERGRLMSEAAQRRPGAMAAVLGLEAEAVREICATAAEQSGGMLVVANDNCPGQVVISGENAAIEAALPLAQERGARRVVKLAVSVASHSPLMEAIASDFQQVLAQTPFTTPRIPIVGNVNAAPLTDPEAIRAELGAQLTSTVRWTESVRYMVEQGVETFVELGPKDVLSGLVKRIARKTRRFALNSAEAVRAFLEEARQ